MSPFLRTGRPITGPEVRRFLVLDPNFPRTMLACATDAENAVRALQRQGVSDGSLMLREVGMLRSELEYGQSPTPTEVDRYAEEGREAAHRAGDEASRAFFRQHGTIVWSH
jgi:uncharacterized alpha-E superfamily protein